VSLSPTTATTLRYAAYGATAGSILPGIGTLAGGIVGAGVGLGSAYFDGDDAPGLVASGPLVSLAPAVSSLRSSSYAPLTYRGRDGSSAGRRRLSFEAQREMVEVIGAELVRIGLPQRLGIDARTVTIAAVCNAVHESGLDPGAWRREPDGRTSYGLFQCLVGVHVGRTYKVGGAGEGHAPGRLILPAYNTGVIAKEAARVAVSVRPPRDLAGITGWWCVHVERPAQAAARAEERITWLRREGLL